MPKQLLDSCSAEVDRCSGVFALVAAALLLLACSVDRCPEGTHARFDQCVRVSDRDDSGAPVLPDAGLESGVDGADAAEIATDADPESGVDGGCDAERMWRAGRCVLKEIYVDALDGDDTNEGTLRRPLKTFKKAVGDALEGQIVNFEAREYAVASGDDFTPPVPHGVTLRTRPDSRPQAVFLAGGVQSLVFAGTATLISLHFSGFKSVVATTGEQQLTSVLFTDLVKSFAVASHARTRCESCWIRDEEEVAGSQRAEPLIAVSDSATLTLSKGSTNSMWDPLCQQAMRTELIRVTGTGNLVLDAHSVSNGAERVVYLQTRGSVKVISSTLDDGCQHENMLVWQPPVEQPVTATLELDDSSFGGGVTVIGSTQSLRVRRSEFRGPFVIQSATSGTYDLGLPTRTSIADVGWNTFAHLAVTGRGIVVSASGNKWQASLLQGADEYGHYPPGETRRVDAGESVTGENFSLTGDGGLVELQF